ncbi:HPF/RaiA family ribosome-associated protein [Candidatus Shapirobacteria bacterium]|nr:HPF/RaiA family ribosome-associated protein [Candidatus Shapirobacteria bacterium]
MNIQITGDNFELSEKIKKMIDEKIGKKLDILLSTFAPEMKTADLRIERDKLKNVHLRFTMLLPGKERVFSETTHRFLKSALIDLGEQLEKQIKRYRDL